MASFYKTREEAEKSLEYQNKQGNLKEAVMTVEKTESGFRIKRKKCQGKTMYPLKKYALSEWKKQGFEGPPETTKCDICGNYHLGKSFPLCPDCSDSNGKKKAFYPSKLIAQKRADHLNKTSAFTIQVYPCLHHKGKYHLTHKGSI